MNAATPGHERFQEWVALSAYGELDADAAAELDRHLAGCAACRALERDLREGVVAAAGTHPLPDVDPAWASQLRRSLAARRSRASWRYAAAALVLIAAGALLGVALFRPVVQELLPRDQVSADVPSRNPGVDPGLATAPRLAEPFARSLPPPPATTHGAPVAWLLAR